MPYAATSDLPQSVTNVLPSHAQSIYKEAFNCAYEQYATTKERRGNETREETAHKVAWGAVKKAGYHKGSDDNWHKS